MASSYAVVRLLSNELHFRLILGEVKSRHGVEQVLRRDLRLVLFIRYFGGLRRQQLYELGRTLKQELARFCSAPHACNTCARSVERGARTRRAQTCRQFRLDKLGDRRSRQELFVIGGVHLKGARAR